LSSLRLIFQQKMRRFHPKSLLYSSLGLMRRKYSCLFGESLDRVCSFSSRLHISLGIVGALSSCKYAERLWQHLVFWHNVMCLRDVISFGFICIVFNFVHPFVSQSSEVLGLVLISLCYYHLYLTGILKVAFHFTKLTVCTTFWKVKPNSSFGLMAALLIHGPISTVVKKLLWQLGTFCVHNDRSLNHQSFKMNVSKEADVQFA